MKLNSFLKIAIFGFLLSCSEENIIFNDYIDIENTQLSFKDTIVFQTKIPDTINPHNIFLQLRTSTDYKWSNMFVFLKFTSQIIKQGQIPLKFFDGQERKLEW